MTTPTPVTTTNAGAQDAVTLIENAGKVGEDAAETAIIAAVPFMGTPVLKQLWEAIFDRIFQLFLKPIARFGGMVVIQAEEYLALRGAVQAQAALDAAKKAGNSDAISQASSAVDQAVASVVHYVGSTKS